MSLDLTLQLIATTTPEYMKQVEDAAVRNNVVFALLKQRKRIEYDSSGQFLQWPVKINLPESYGFTGGATIDYEESDKYRMAQLEWRGVYSTDMMTEPDKLRNKGTAAIIERYAQIMPDLEESLVDKFSMSLYSDGNTVSDLPHGLETIFTRDTGVAVTAADRVAIPSTTYAGLPTKPGSLGGSWSASLTTKPNAAFGYDWPSGEGTRNFDAWSPKLLNWSSTAWAGATNTSFGDTGERVIRQGINWCMQGGGKPGRVDLCILSPELYTEYLNGMAARNRVIMPAKNLIDLGFPEGVAQDGAEITQEFGVPLNTGYLLNVDKVQVKSLGSQLFMSKGPDWEPRTFSYLFAVYFFGNYKFASPKFFAKLYPYA